MKHFYPTYLYVKTHNITGLKYFGKTTNDPYTYYGSGKHWLSHLKKHGYNITTEIIGLYIDKDECQSAANKFSIDNNIVESKEWANLIIENGTDGGQTDRKNYKPHSAESKKKISNANKGRAAWNKGKSGITPGNTNPRSEETKKKLREANLGKTQSIETIAKRTEKLRGRKRPEVSEKLRGRPKTPETIEKMKAAQQNKGPLSEETKIKIKQARAKQENIFPIGEFLKGKVIVVDKLGNRKSIPKDVYYSQTGVKENWEWVSHKSKEAKTRR